MQSGISNFQIKFRLRVRGGTGLGLGDVMVSQVRRTNEDLGLRTPASLLSVHTQTDCLLAVSNARV